jgi:hypothetical protein
LIPLLHAIDSAQIENLLIIAREVSEQALATLFTIRLSNPDPGARRANPHDSLECWV